jgi:cytochrome c peroxidase
LPRANVVGSQDGRTAGLDPASPETTMPIRRAFAPATLFAIFLTLPAASQTPTPTLTSPPSAFPRAEDERALSDLQLLGKRLFEDTNLSEPKGQACSSCHDPKRAFQGNNRSPIAAVALGSRPGQFGNRKTPTIMYMAYSPAFGFAKDEDEGEDKLEARGGQFWDGRAADLVEQPSGPLMNPAEMNNPSADAVVEKVKAASYAPIMLAVFGPDAFADPKAAFQRVSQSLFAYEATERFAPFASKFDDYLRGKARLTPIEARGLALFVDPKRGNCLACHAGKPDSKDPTDWLLTDFTYDALGAPRNAAIPANADPLTFDLGLCQRPGLEAALPKSVPLASLCGAFKVPTLRNIAVRAPYFHNGAIATLRDAVAFYATRDTDPKRWYPTLKTGEPDKFNDLPSAYKANVNVEEVPYDRKPGQKPRLDDRDVDALVAFLNTLTDKGMR